MHSAIFANLTPEDDKRFHAGGVSYSGATGAGATMRSHGKHAPYIATGSGEIERGLIAMGWKHAEIFVEGNQMIVKRKHDPIKVFFVYAGPEEF